MRKLRFILPVCLVTLCLSCGESETRKTLQTIDNIIEDNIDSAKVLLGTIDQSSLTNRKDAADYSLYNSMIVIRSTISPVADSLITPAMKYYNNGPADKRMKVLFYLSSMKMREDDSENCLLLLEEAREVAEEQKDYLYTGKCEHVLGNYYFRKEYYVDALRMYEESLSNYRQAGTHNYDGLILSLIGISNLRLGKYDTALDYLESSSHCFETQDSVYLASVYWNIAMTYFDKQNYPESKKFAKKALSVRKATTLRRDLVYAKSIYETNPVLTQCVMDSIKFYMDRASSKCKNYRDTCAVYEVSADIQASEGNYEEAYSKLKKAYLNAYDEIYSRQDTSPGVVQRKYYEAKARLEANKFYRAKLRSWGVGVLLIFFISSMIAYYKRSYRKTEEIARYYHSLADELSTQVSEQNQAILDLKTRIRGIYKSQFRRLGELVETLHITQGRTDETVLRKRVAEITSEIINDRITEDLGGTSEHGNRQHNDTHKGGLSNLQGARLPFYCIYDYRI